MVLNTNLMIGNAIQSSKNGMTISADVNDNKSNIWYVEKIMIGILSHVPVNLIKTVRLMNNSSIALASKVLLII